MSKRSRVLVANRGEIAVRIIRACHSLGVQTVCLASEADLDSLGPRMADRVICAGGARSAGSYLNVPAIVEAALESGCDAVHPGYGFLSESPGLAQACRSEGLIFVGPQTEVLLAAGNKLHARRYVSELGLPVLPGGDVGGDAERAISMGNEIGWPVLVKAALGGGGRGMKLVRSARELNAAIMQASAEAAASFGDGSIYVERYLPRARHVEVQILGDAYGGVRHFGERDCSCQRRYQKLIEEAPSMGLSLRLRERILASACQIASSLAYQGAGTVEFLVDPVGEEFFFLEINARIQVEHPVSELVTGVDLVAAQLRVAFGDALWMAQDEIEVHGHAIECRVNAEMPEQGFMPSPGRITRWRMPEDTWARVDSHCFPGYVVPPFYDSLLAKVCVHGSDRAEAVARMSRALNIVDVGGVQTNAAFLGTLVASQEFIDGDVWTGWVEDKLGNGSAPV